jgi:hypothetical protein
MSGKRRMLFLSHDIQPEMLARSCGIGIRVFLERDWAGQDWDWVCDFMGLSEMLKDKFEFLGLGLSRAFWEFGISMRGKPERRGKIPARTKGKNSSILLCDVSVTWQFCLIISWIIVESVWFWCIWMGDLVWPNFWNWMLIMCAHNEFGERAIIYRLNEQAYENCSSKHTQSNCGCQCRSAINIKTLWAFLFWVTTYCWISYWSDIGMTLKQDRRGCFWPNIYSWSWY